MKSDNYHLLTQQDGNGVSLFVYGDGNATHHFISTLPPNLDCDRLMLLWQV